MAVMVCIPPGKLAPKQSCCTGLRAKQGLVSSWSSKRHAQQVGSCKHMPCQLKGWPVGWLSSSSLIEAFHSHMVVLIVQATYEASQGVDGVQNTAALHACRA